MIDLIVMEKNKYNDLVLCGHIQVAIILSDMAYFGCVVHVMPVPHCTLSILLHWSVIELMNTRWQQHFNIYINRTSRENYKWYIFFKVLNPISDGFGRHLAIMVISYYYLIILFDFWNQEISRDFLFIQLYFCSHLLCFRDTKMLFFKKLQAEN